MPTRMTTTAYCGPTAVGESSGRRASRFPLTTQGRSPSCLSSAEQPWPSEHAQLAPAPSCGPLLMPTYLHGRPLPQPRTAG